MTRLPTQAIGFNRDNQPKKGELCVGCEHVGLDNRRFLFVKAQGGKITTIDQNSGKLVYPEWLVFCHTCRDECSGQLQGLKLRRCFEWPRNGVNQEDPLDPLKKYDA